ncbi:MAG: hypothetical protein NTY60_11405 [Proteobacteria bacterium]|nr:hypothetical protein [Pseudomonadota bacterium]
MNIIFLIYGFSFLALGMVILAQPQIKSCFKLFDFIWLLAAFGIIHGALEWMDLWTMVRGENSYLNAAKPFFLLVSYVFLVEFGRRIVIDALPLPSSAVRWLLDASIHMLLLGGILLAVVSSDDSIAALVVWSRYLLGFVGSTLAGAGFLLYCRFHIQSSLTQKEFRSIKYACYVAALAFIAYGVFGGLVVPRAACPPANWLNQENFMAVTGVPVQLFRAGCALLVAISVTHILFELRIHELTRNITGEFNDPER